jgi:UDP:flavonoid glycosyltransferase YjiC (YdhE family)
MTSYRQVLLIYCGIMLALTFPYWGLGNELVSSCHAVVMGVSQATTTQVDCEHRKFTDFENDFLPKR